MATPLLDRINARKAPEPRPERSDDNRPAWVRRAQSGNLYGFDQITGQPVAGVDVTGRVQDR